MVSLSGDRTSLAESQEQILGRSLSFDPAHVEWLYLNMVEIGDCSIIYRMLRLKTRWIKNAQTEPKHPLWEVWAAYIHDSFWARCIIDQKSQVEGC